MTAAYDTALAKRQQVRSKTGINPNAEFQAGWEAAMRFTNIEWGIRCVTDEGEETMWLATSKFEAVQELAFEPDNSQLVTRTTTEWENAE